MTVKWNNTILAFRPFNETEALKQNVARLKKNIFPAVLPDGYLTPLPKQRYDRKKHLAKLIDCATQTLIGQHIFHRLSADTSFISCDLEHNKAGVDILGNYIKEKNMVNICPKTLCCPVRIQVNALIHESLHALHAQIENEIQKKLFGHIKSQESNLNFCDQFCLHFLSEFACCCAGQLAGLCFSPSDSRKVVDVRPLFFSPIYWTEYYTGCLKALEQEEKPCSFLNLKHTPAYYTIAREYFHLHPELRNAQTIHRIHKGWKIFATHLKAELEKTYPQKISSQSIFASFENKIPQLVEQAVNIKF